MGNILNKTGIRSKYRNQTREIIQKIPLNEFNKLILKKRYVYLMEQLDIKRSSTSFWYSVFTFIITLGSILVPALISIEDKSILYPPEQNISIGNFGNQTIIKTENNDTLLDKQEHVLFWLTFCISLLVTICNALIKLYSLDKVYVIRNLKYDELRREGWFFYTLTGDYKNFKNNNEAFKLFITRIETIKSMLLHDELTPEFNLNSVPNVNEYMISSDTSDNIKNGNNENRIGVETCDDGTRSDRTRDTNVIFEEV
jgi:hypothetical protein